MSVDICPICRGKGKVIKGFYDYENEIMISTPLSETEECRACKGLGIVWNNVPTHSYYPLPNLPVRENNLPIRDIPYNPCDTCPVRRNPDWNGSCHCTLPYIYNNTVMRY